MFIAIRELKLELSSEKIGHLFHAPISYVCPFTVIHEFDLELEKAQIGTESAIFHPAWPWNLTDDLEK